MAALPPQTNSSFPAIRCRYWVSWCNSYNGHGPTIGLGWTDDFRSFTQVEIVFDVVAMSSDVPPSTSVM